MTMARSMKAKKPSALFLSVSRAFFFLMLGTLATCCSRPAAPPRPAGIISLDTMTLFLTDIHIIEGASTGQKIMGDTLTTDEYHAKVFAKYGATKEQFQESFDYYSGQPELMTKIYEGVIENLNKTQVQPPRESLHEPLDGLPPPTDSTAGDTVVE